MKTWREIIKSRYIYILCFACIVIGIIVIRSNTETNNGFIDGIFNIYMMRLDIQEKKYTEITAFYKVWDITEYLGKSVPYHEEYEEIYDNEIFINKYIGTQIIIDEQTVEYCYPPTELGYVYETWSDLFFVYRNPSNLEMMPPFYCADIKLKERDEAFSIIIDSEENAAVYIQGEFYRIETAN